MSDNSQLPPLELPAYLPPGAWNALEHWHKYRPKMYAELHASGKLHEMAIAAYEATSEEQYDLHMALIKQGYASPIAFEMAREAVRERYIYLPTEEDVPELQVNGEGLYYFESEDTDDEQELPDHIF
jgi:hypothetical protein